MNADEVLTTYWANRSYPVDPFLIAAMNNISVIYDPSLQEKGISGSISKVDELAFAEIRLNPFDSYFRKRFTMAHELGHFFLEHQFPLNREDRMANFNLIADPVETQANNFAASLLMPREFVEYIMFTLKSDFKEMARKLEVSTPALGYRLKNLGIIDE